MKKENNYYVVWCDDKIESLWSEETQEIFEDYHCKLVFKAHSADELFNYLRNNGELVDAVILDFNVNESDILVSGSDDKSGFLYARQERKHYPKLPFYLFSAYSAGEIKAQLLKTGINLSGDYFFGDPNHIRYFPATNIEGLLVQLCEDVEDTQTPQHKVRMDHYVGLSAFEKLTEEPKGILGILMSTDNERDGDSLIEKLNYLRCQVEFLFTTLLPNEGIFPDNVRINEIPEVLGGTHPRYQTKTGQPLMPLPLLHSLEFYLDLVQEGSHKKRGLKYDTRDYIRKEADDYLIKVFAYISLDIAVWCEKFIKECKQVSPFKPIMFDATVKVERGSYYVEYGEDRYKLQWNRDVTLEEGDEVSILNFAPNTTPEDNKICKFFVQRNNWCKLNNNDIEENKHDSNCLESK